MHTSHQEKQTVQKLVPAAVNVTILDGRHLKAVQVRKGNIEKGTTLTVLRTFV